MFSIEEINEMQKTIERKDRIIKVLKERVRQWVKEYNILDAIIEMYKMSENEANEIIAELKAENEQLKALCDTYKTCYQAKHSDIKCLLPKYRTTLQEIKAIAEKELSYDMVGNEHRHYRNYDFIRHLITKAEEE